MGKKLGLRKAERFRLSPWFALLFVIGIIGAVLVALDQRIPPVQPGPPVLIYRHDIDETIQTDLETYLLGVVAAEMPATFHLEALKAQAVAARTYALYTLQTGKPLSPATEAVLSTDYRSAQAWISHEAFAQRWQGEAPRRWKRIALAVSSTYGQVLTHNGQPILATYHSSSGGHTENSENYWSAALPYLVGRPDPYDAVSPHRDETVTLPVMAFLSRMDVAVDDVTALTVAVDQRYPSGRVAQARIGETTLTGRDIREKLGLRSTMFELDYKDDTVTVTQHGFGHGVGMSQYGAHGMAQEGYTYEDILRYYYSGISLTKWYD